MAQENLLIKGIVAGASFVSILLLFAYLLGKRRAKICPFCDEDVSFQKKDTHYRYKCGCKKGHWHNAISNAKQQWKVERLCRKESLPTPDENIPT